MTRSRYSNHPDPAIDAALDAAFRSHPYYAQSLLRLRIVADPNVPTMATSTHWVTHYNPATVAGWSVDETAAVLVHELEHLLRDHAGRCGTRDHEQWNRAADAEINERLPGLPDGAIYPETLGTTRGRTAETYYAAGNGGGSQGQPGGDGAGQPADCGSAAGGDARPWESGDAANPGDGESNDNGDGARQQAAQQVIARGTGASDDIRQWAESTLGIDRSRWLTALATVLSSSVAAHGAPTRWVWPGRRDLADVGAMVPRWTGSRPKVAVVIDTSGSITPQDLDLARTCGEFLSRAADATFYSCNMRARLLGTRLPDTVTGHGGTDMGEGIRHAVADGHKVVVVVTDCETPWGEDPGVPVIVGANAAASVGGRGGYLSRIPRWAKVIAMTD